MRKLCVGVYYIAPPQCLTLRKEKQEMQFSTRMCSQTCNSVVNMLVMGFVLGLSLMVISTKGILLYAQVL